MRCVNRSVLPVIKSDRCERELSSDVWNDLRHGARRAGAHATHTARSGRVSVALACCTMLLTSACLSGVGMAPDTIGEGPARPRPHFSY